MPVEIVPEAPPEPEVKHVAFMGAEFAVASKIGLMPLMKFAKISKSGIDSSDIEAMAAMYDMLQQCIADDPVFVLQGRVTTREACLELSTEDAEQVVVFGGWGAFEDHANKTRAGDDDLLQVVRDVMEILTERPTSRPSDSSAGPQQTAPTSAENSSSLEVVRRLKSQGRPDLAMVVRQQTG